MRRNGKAAVLIVATLYAAGCARSDYWLSQQERQSWRQIEDRRIAQAKDAPPPKILPDTFIAAAQLYETQHDFRKALVMYDKAIASCAGYARAYHRKGLLLSAMTRYEASEECLRLAVEFKPENARIRNDYAFALMILNDWTAAELELRRAIELDPDLNRAYINLGMTLCQLDRFREGLSAFCKALPQYRRPVQPRTHATRQTTLPGSRQCVRNRSRTGPQLLRGQGATGGTAAQTPTGRAARPAGILRRATRYIRRRARQSPGTAIQLPEGATRLGQGTTRGQNAV